MKRKELIKKSLESMHGLYKKYFSALMVNVLTSVRQGVFSE